MKLYYNFNDLEQKIKVCEEMLPMDTVYEIFEGFNYDLHTMYRQRLYLQELEDEVKILVRSNIESTFFNDEFDFKWRYE